jgi:hypothetical protein
MRYWQARAAALARLRVLSQRASSGPVCPSVRIALSVAGFQNFGQQAAKTMGVFLMKQVHARLVRPESRNLLPFGALLSIIRTLIAIIRTRIATASTLFGALAVCSLGFSRARATRRCAISTISIRSLSSGTWRCR